MYILQQVGTILQSRYCVVSVLGQGGTGVMYEAEDKQVGLRVAIKELSLQGLSDWKKLELFEREAQILKKLNHPAIPKYLDYFQIDTADNRFFYLVQALAEGRSLADLVAAGERFSEIEVRRIALEILQILQYLHGLNPPVIHRDIKPNNIIRHENGEIFLVDFGAVQTVYRETVAFGSTVVGTYGYMPPEQFRGQAYPTTDLYGLGATLLHLLTHRHPGDLPQKRLRYDFRAYTNTSEPFAQWLDGLLEPLAEDRFDSVSTALLALTNPPPSQVRSKTTISQQNTTSLPQKPDISSVELVRSQQHLWIKIPLHVESSSVKIVGLISSLLGNIILLFVNLFVIPTLLNDGDMMGLLFLAAISIASICSTITILRTPDRKISAVLDIQENTFTFRGYPYQKKFVGNIEKLQGAVISDQGITLKAKGKLHWFGCHLTDDEKEWIVSEIQLYLQKRKQLSLKY